MKSKKRQDPLAQMFEFGGELTKQAKYRCARPVSTKDPMHLVLKSSKAVGRNSFGHSRNLRRVNEIFEKHCAKYGVKLKMYSNNFTHIHALVKFPSRALYLRFIKSVTGALAMAITGSKKTSRGSGPFFDFRPFTRIVRGWKPYQIICDYIRLNQLEAAGIIPYQARCLRNLSELESSFF